MSIPLSLFLLPPKDRVKVYRIDYVTEEGPQTHFTAVHIDSGPKYKFLEYIAEQGINIGPIFTITDGETITKHDTADAIRFYNTISRLFNDFTDEYGDIDPEEAA